MKEKDRGQDFTKSVMRLLQPQAAAPSEDGSMRTELLSNSLLTPPVDGGTLCVLAELIRRFRSAHPGTLNSMAELDITWKDLG
jgi:hypothetical protein